MKRLVLILALASGAFAAGAQAHVFDVATSVTARDIPAGRVAPGARVVVVGRVLAARDACEDGKLVKLYGVKAGADRLLATDRTDGDGEYGFSLRATRDLVVYVRFDGSGLSSYGHRHRCRADSSRAIRIDVRGR